MNNNNKYNKKILVVDDEYTECDKEDFIDDVGIAEEQAFFASSYEEAKNIIECNSDIILCFVDCKIPKTSKKLYDFKSLSNNNDYGWGIDLVEYINKTLSKAQIAVYSAYVAQDNLRNYIKKFNNVSGCYDKPEGLQYRRLIYLQALEKYNDFLSSNIENNKSSKTTNDKLSNLISNSSSKKNKIFKYEDLNEDDRIFITDKAIQIKFLIRRSVQDIINIGKYFTEIKEKLQHGQFYPWLDLEFKDPNTNVVPYTSIFRFMTTYQLLKSINLTDLSQANILPSALYMIASKKVDKNALIEMKQLIEAGVTINLEVGKYLKNKYSKKDETQLSLIDIEKTENIVNKNFSQPSNTDTFSLANNLEKVSKQKIIKVLPRQNKWQIGRHLLICAEPDNLAFNKISSINIELCLCFPKDKYWNLNTNLKYKSIFNFYSQYENLDLALLLESIHKIIEITTNENDNILICYLPTLDILSLIEDLGCQGYIFEPNYQKCLNMIEKYC
ncbi:diguanylate cyclase (plasmid) [Chondrocystis sp. NIES-4102]|nr:diguanylate cyclase [Chondrocystis sp. NIES-4102]